MREVTHTADGPRKVTADDVDEKYGDVAVCLCGLSEKAPFCDGSHKRTEGERPDERYKYVDGERRRVEFVVAEDDRDGAADGSSE